MSETFLLKHSILQSLTGAMRIVRERNGDERLQQQWKMQHIPSDIIKYEWRDVPVIETDGTG